MKWLLIGNSGSGKSTLAARLARTHEVAKLDLDAIVWVPGQVAVPRPQAAVLADLDGFIAAQPRWVIEGCYGDLAQHAAPHCTQLVFLNPGIDACLANNARRPWEPHKYASAAAQDAMFEHLQAWVRDYARRTDAWSYAAHRAVFDAHPGAKIELVDPQAIAAYAG